MRTAPTSSVWAGRRHRSPDPAGPQHNEQAGGFLKAGVRDLPLNKETGLSEAPIHQSVYRRFEAGSVLLYDRMGDYRPDNMRAYVDFRHYFDLSPKRGPSTSLTILN
jgi:hypothetical protein